MAFSSMVGRRIKLKTIDSIEYHGILKEYQANGGYLVLRNCKTKDGVEVGITVNFVISNIIWYLIF
ncbi:hypothetical protein [Clostridium hydrogenum]|uniref:hypothetical protein n=1 Tax=Clostridium hydrogenum TaxID=2855764 RepID=UPI001F3BF933|nr:hypothetical protein [Clostridium hydrogenum]